MTQVAAIANPTEDFDPYAIPLDEIDLSNAHYFQDQQHWKLFERLRN